MTRIQGDLLARSFRFAEAIVYLIDALPNNHKGWELGRQILRSGTGVGANCREAHNALTDADFAHKCSIARKEASEVHYWLELCATTELLPADRAAACIREADELARILSSIVKGTHEHMTKTRPRGEANG